MRPLTKILRAADKARAALIDLFAALGQAEAAALVRIALEIEAGRELEIAANGAVLIDGFRWASNGQVIDAAAYVERILAE